MSTNCVCELQELIYAVMLTVYNAKPLSVCLWVLCSSAATDLEGRTGGMQKGFCLQLFFLDQLLLPLEVLQLARILHCFVIPASTQSVKIISVNSLQGLHHATLTANIGRCLCTSSAVAVVPAVPIRAGTTYGCNSDHSFGWNPNDVFGVFSIAYRMHSLTPGW